MKPSIAVLIILALASAGQSAQPAAATMEQRISAVVRDFRGVLGVAAMDLRTREWVAVNADTRFPTASTIKRRRAGCRWTRRSR